MLSPSPGGQKLEIKQLMALAPLRGSAEKPGFLQLSQPLGAGNSPWPSLACGHVTVISVTTWLSHKHTSHAGFRASPN